MNKNKNQSILDTCHYFPFDFYLHFNREMFTFKFYVRIYSRLSNVQFTINIMKSGWLIMSKFNQFWDNLTPLEIMTEEGLIGIARVYQCVNFMRGQ